VETAVVRTAVTVPTEGNLSAVQACLYAFPRVRAVWTDSVYHNGVALPPSRHRRLGGTVLVVQCLHPLPRRQEVKITIP
jgi:hypothetical protein